jgi:hypothetical protein
VAESQPSNATHAEMSEGVTRATTTFEQMMVAPSTLERIGDAVSASNSIVDTMMSTAATWDPLIQRLKIFTEIVDRISEVRCPAALPPVVLNICLCRFIRMQKWLGVSYPQHTRYGLSVLSFQLLLATQNRLRVDCFESERA